MYVENKEILIALKERLEDGGVYMCHILEDMGVHCYFLKSSGIEDLWLARGNRILDAYQLSTTNPAISAPFEEFKVAIRKEKIKCINILLENNYK